MFCKWCNTFSISSLPAEDTYVALYLNSLLKNKHSVSVIDEAVYSINWVHGISGFSSPCKSTLVKNVQEGAHRIIGKNTVKKEPITADILVSLVNKFGGTETNLRNLRTVCMCVLGYSGFLRCSELGNIRRNDIQMFDTHMTTNIRKTDLHREGADVVISKTGNRLVPYVF